MGLTVEQAGTGFVTRIRKVSKAAESGKRDTLHAAGQAAKKVHLKRIRKDSGGDLKLSGVNRAKGRPGGVKVGARYDVSNRQVTIKATGPMPLIANDTAGRVIRSAYAKGRRRKGFVGPTFGGQFKGDRRAVLNIPGIGYRRSVRHPGTRGKGTWTKSVKPAKKAANEAITDMHINIVKRAFG